MNRLEVAKPDDPGTNDLLAELRALKRIRDHIADMPEHVKQTFGVGSEDDIV